MVFIGRRRAVFMSHRIQLNMVGKVTVISGYLLVAGV